MNKPNESDTPETDACWDDTSCNILDFARRLERERDQLRTQLTQRDEALKVAGEALKNCLNNSPLNPFERADAIQSALRRIEELTKGEGP